MRQFYKLKLLFAWLSSWVTRTQCQSSLYPWDVKGGFRCERWKHHTGKHRGRSITLPSIASREW